VDRRGRKARPVIACRQCLEVMLNATHWIGKEVSAMRQDVTWG
jgi:hypothetical protein